MFPVRGHLGSHQGTSLFCDGDVPADGLDSHLEMTEFPGLSFVLSSFLIDHGYSTERLLYNSFEDWAEACEFLNLLDPKMVERARALPSLGTGA